MSHLAALLLLAVDVLSRAWRIQLATAASGARLGFREAVRLNLYGEAASSITPNRLGGEAARFVGLTWAGVRPVPALVSLGVEVAAEWPVFGAVGIVLLVRYVPDLEAAARAWLRSHGLGDLLLLGAATLAAFLGLWAVQRLVRAGGPRHRVRRQWRVALAHVRRAPWWVLGAGAALTAVSLVARALVLPVLAWAVPEPPEFGRMFYGSLALLHAPLVVPLPAGGGGIEVAFLSGFAGEFGPDRQILMLLVWRFYTTVLLALLGAYLLVRAHGGNAARELLTIGWRRRSLESPRVGPTK